MTKEQLIEAMAKSAGVNKREANDALDGFIEAVTKSLKKGDKVSLVGFGTFSVVKRAARQGVNPKTGEKIRIPARKVAKFKAGSKLKAAVK